jgi:hypothetical protein
MPLSVLNGPTIQANESLSEGLDCTSGKIVRLTMPFQWTPANITFQISSDGNFYNDLVDANGNPYTMAVVANSAVILTPLGDFLKAVSFLKIRSGTVDNPVKQDERRDFAVAVEVP